MLLCQLVTSACLLFTSSVLATENLVTSKRGLCYPANNNPEDVRNFNQSDSLITWAYDWSSAPDHLLSMGSAIEYLPMQWGSGNAENFAAAARALGAKTILAFNEPDLGWQANMDPTQAAQVWRTYIQPLKASGVRLGGPAVSNSPNSLPWLQQFMSACADCTIDFISLHWYGESIGEFYDHIWQFQGVFPNYPVWITEYASTSTNLADVLTFMNATTAYLDNLSWVEKYAWFGFFRPEAGPAYNLLDADGGLNALGELYIGSKTVVRSGPVRGQ